MRLDKVVVLLIDNAEAVAAQRLDDPLVFVVQRNMPPAGYKVVEFIVRRIRYADDTLERRAGSDLRFVLCPLPS